MNRRQTILKLIALDVAETGKLSKHGIRLYVENRISWQAVQPTIRAGQAIYDAEQRRTSLDREMEPKWSGIGEH